jgi:Flp pilus assembly protein TadB
MTKDPRPSAADRRALAELEIEQGMRSAPPRRGLQAVALFAAAAGAFIVAFVVRASAWGFRLSVLGTLLAVLAVLVAVWAVYESRQRRAIEAAGAALDGADGSAPP